MVLLVAGIASGAPAAPTPDRLTSVTQGKVTASLRQGSPAYTRESTLVAGVAVKYGGKSRIPYVEVRLRILSPHGSLLYQRTLTHTNVTSTVDFHFERNLHDLKTTTKEGRFRLEARVFATGADPIELYDRLLVVDPTRPKVPLVVVAKIDRAAHERSERALRDRPGPRHRVPRRGDGPVDRS